MFQLESKMSDILNGMSELVYISDVETHELLYINDAGKKLFDIGDLHGLKCYKTLQGLDSPCSFCPNGKLTQDSYYTWTFTNRITKNHYLLKDRLIEWNGRNARMEIAFDITASEQEKIDLKNILEGQTVTFDCVRELYSHSNVQVTIPVILKKLGEYLESDRAYIFEIDGEKMSNTYEWCAEGIAPEIEMLQNVDVSLADYWMPSLKNRECFILSDIENEQDETCRSLLKAQNIHSLIVAPLEWDGELIGFIGVDNPPADKIKNIASLLQTLCYFIMLAYHRGIDKATLTYMSYNDRLTGMHNRNCYIRDLEDDSLSHRQVGVVYMDINGLKDINDRYGHEYGDKVIIECARIMRGFFPGAALYRIGGDEFVVVCRDIPHEEFDAKVRQLKIKFGGAVECRCAIGARWTEEYENLQTLVSSADDMMYEDKKIFYRCYSDSNRYRHYNDAVLELRDTNLLKQRLAEGRFTIFFQAKVAMDDGSPIGAEALVRYSSGSRIIPPGDFISMLENLHTISYVDFFVFEKVCAYLSERLAVGKKIFPVSINLSHATMSEVNFVERLIDAWSKYSVPKEYLELEVTETQFDGNVENFNETISRLRAYGFSVSLDDFGASYASLSLLFSADFDVLKLDKSVIDTVTHSAKSHSILKRLIEACQELGINVIAEGVETEEQVKILRELGLHHAQGYYFGRPIPVEEYMEQFFK